MRAMRIGTAAMLLLALTAVMGGWVAAASTPKLVEVRAAHHRGFDRIVFEFEGPVPDIARVRWAEELRLDPSHKPARVRGDAFLRVRFFPALAHEPKPPHDSTFGSARRAYALPNIVHLVLLGDYEAEVSFGIGLKEKTRILRATTLERPSRFVVDVATASEELDAERTTETTTQSEDETLTATYVTGKVLQHLGHSDFESWEEGGVEHMRGYVRERVVEWSDPRLPSRLVSIWNSIRVDSPDGPAGAMAQSFRLMPLREVYGEGQEQLLASEEGPDGAWAGTGRSITVPGSEALEPMFLTGEGDYAGLSAILVGKLVTDDEGRTDALFEGYIFEGALLPMPDPVELDLSPAE